MPALPSNQLIVRALFDDDSLVDEGDVGAFADRRERAAVFRQLSSSCTLALVDLLAPLVVLPREYVLVQGMEGATRCSLLHADWFRSQW